ncbi:hypothetical protein RA178_06340 [Shewanella oncorhynchi]|uniref:Uncharacterized protein n=1 Tax=Shewanella oncorhynchi TaxID=2726434 RepID=A0AA50KGK1_9GAMM|nr:hypothetical protein [Shewanella oncorhynchi]WMB74231.1 hypothetical protein RA178_06340 [Shewanella oncorhynchi]
MSIQRATYNIEIYRGDTPKFSYQLISVDQETGEEVPVDITRHILTGQVRRNSETDTVWYEFPLVKSDPTQGKFYWQITKADSENLLPTNSKESDNAVYDIQIEFEENVFTFVKGSFKITRDITRR